MSNLHAYFALRNQQGFTRALDGSRSQANAQTSGPALSSSSGKSWTRTSGLSASQPVDVNAKDWLGRTVLHIACATTEPFALACVRLLLAHPNINVNIQDTESGWTALHRALYAGNLATCILLLQRTDTDIQLRDYEGYTPFDIYNSTVEGTKPGAANLLSDSADILTDVFTWGANRNAALGHGDSDDRAYPDQVTIHRQESPEESSLARFTPVQVKGISMANLHTTVITNEKRGNLRACGFGSGGRLGSGQHTQYQLQRVPQFIHHVIAVALGQDHTLALTSDGEVLSWGLNRFSQLGYVVEPPTPGPLHTKAMEEPIQAVARKIIGPLRKEIVVGVAACKTASACWTDTDVFTWGTNNGQLGYDRTAQSVQVLPRKVTGAQGVTGLAMTDAALVCLLETMDVICFRDDTRFRIKFPIPEMSDLPPYQPPSNAKPPIVKVTSCDGVFAALSSRGDVYTFSVPPPTADGFPVRGDRVAVKPQRVWSLRKAFDPVKDIALGSDGEIILSTASGHVFVRSRLTKGGVGGKSLKFHRVPYIHRAVRVCANSTGAFAALRLNYVPKDVPVVGPTLTVDLKEVRPWISFDAGGSVPTVAASPDDDDESSTLGGDVMAVAQLCALLRAEKDCQKNEHRGLFRGPVRNAHGADLFVQAGLDIPGHRVILATRSSVLRGLIDGTVPVLRDVSITLKYHAKGATLPRLTVTGCQPMTILLVLEYIYTDDVPALWDRRVYVPCAGLLARLKITPEQVKSEMETLARILDLPVLMAVLSATVKRIPTATLNGDMGRLLLTTVNRSPGVKPDVILELADKQVACYSVVLRARSPFFRSFFDDEDWTIDRWASGTLRVGMKHLEWRTMSFVMSWMCQGKEDDLFDHLDDVSSVSDLLDLVFAVMAIASELLLDKLMLICSSTILRHVTLNNVSALLADATYYNALELVNSLQAYVVSNLEAIMEGHLLDGLHTDLTTDLTLYVRKQQANMHPIVRSNVEIESALRKHAAWLDVQDFPLPIPRSQRPARDSPKMLPIASEKAARIVTGPAASPLSSPSLASMRQPSQDNIFSMEEESGHDTIPALSIGQPQMPHTGYTLTGPHWKSTSASVTAKTGMKTIIAEAEISKAPLMTPSGTLPRATSVIGFDAVEHFDPSSGASKWSQKPSQRERRKLQSQSSGEPHDSMQRVVSSGSAWKSPAANAASAMSLSMHGVHKTSQPFIAVRVDGPQSPSAGASSVKASKPQPITPASLLHGTAPLPKPGLSPATSGPSLPGVMKRSSSAWTSAPAQIAPSSPVPGLSFAAIQQQQRDHVAQPKGKRSLREIQQEEQARREEVDFLKWWTAEEERLKVEVEADVSRVLSAGTDVGASAKRGRGYRKGGRGGGRGRDSEGHGRGGSLVMSTL